MTRPGGSEGPPLGREAGSLTDEGAANLFEGKIDWLSTAGMAEWPVPRESG